MAEAAVKAVCYWSCCDISAAADHGASTCHVYDPASAEAPVGALSRKQPALPMRHANLETNSCTGQNPNLSASSAANRPPSGCVMSRMR